MKLRVVLVDDHQPFRQRLRELLQSDHNIEIVAEAGSGQELLDLPLSTEIDAACMDISMPGMNGIEATQRLLAGRAGVRVIGLSAYADNLYVEAMMRAGAVGYFTKGDAGEGLLRALHTATRERPCFGSDISFVAVPKNASAEAAPPDDSRKGAGAMSLGTKEHMVLRLLAAGATRRQIACSLSVDAAMVDVYCRNIRRRLQLNDDADLREYALSQGEATG